MANSEFEEIENRAQAGDGEACLLLYSAYARGKGVQRDIERAMQHLRRAAELGHAEAQFELSRAIFADDAAESLRWTQQAANAGHVRANAAVGSRLLRGHGAAIDLNAAVRHLELAAAAGDSNARAELQGARRRMRVETAGEEAALREVIAEHGLAAHEQAILALQAPSVRLVATPATQATNELAHSRIGGAPDLPAELTWPERNGRPLAFLGQIALRDVAAFDHEAALPHAGLLAFFSS